MRVRLLYLTAASLVLIAILLGVSKKNSRRISLSAWTSTGRVTQSPSDDKISQVDRKSESEVFQRVEPEPRKVSAEEIHLYADNPSSKNTEEHFYQNSDFGIQLKEKGVTEFFQLMRNTLKGDREALSKVFNLPQTEGEGHMYCLRGLVESLGAHYFVHELSKNPVEVQRRIVETLSPGWMSERSAGDPLIMDGQTYHEFGRLGDKL